MKNIFQGNNLLINCVKETLGLPDMDREWQLTQDMYFETFFYLTKRFGPPKIYDDYKDAGTWCFEVKKFQIHVYLNSSWVTFMVFGKTPNHLIESPFRVKYLREQKKVKHLMIPYDLTEREKLSEEQIKIFTKVFDEFVDGNNVRHLSNKEFNENTELLRKYGRHIDNYNNSLISVTWEEMHKLYGDDYKNAYVRFALKTLEQFLYNMQTPIWVRDCPFNIKGRMTDEEARFFDRYSDNVKIRCTNKKQKTKKK
jgi:hypothetical protein